jgi:predicted Rossmann fold flavoprotein
LQISSYWREGETIHFDLLPGTRAAELIEQARGANTDPVSALAAHWPRRFAEAWCERYALPKPLRHHKARELADLATLLHAWPLAFSGTEGYPKAEVTLGGVDTRELSSKTMEARNVPGLFFIGEVTDVTGWLGGYNFQWAWASGHAAGQVV